MLPAAAHLNRLASPDSGSAIEVEKISRAIPRGLLNHKVSIEHDRLQTGQKVVRTIDVGPAHLRTAYDRIGEVVNQLAQKIRFRHKVSIKDRDQIAFRRLQAVFQRPGFESRAILPMNIVNIETARRILCDCRARESHGLVGRIVEHLNFHPLMRIVNLAHRFHQTLDHVHLIEERELHSDKRQFAGGEFTLWLWRKPRVSPEVDYLLDAIDAINGQDRKSTRLQDENGPIESIELIERTDVRGGLIDDVTEAGR